MHRMTPKLPQSLKPNDTPQLFALRLAISEILALFHFPIGHNVNFQSFFFKLKFEIPKFQEASFVWIVTGNIQIKLSRKRIKIVGGVVF